MVLIIVVVAFVVVIESFPISLLCRRNLLF
jgi:hypothetical protein